MKHDTLILGLVFIAAAAGVCVPLYKQQRTLDRQQNAASAGMGASLDDMGTDDTTARTALLRLVSDLKRQPVDGYALDFSASKLRLWSRVHPGHAWSTYSDQLQAACIARSHNINAEASDIFTILSNAP